MSHLKNSLLSNATLKVVSLLFGSCFWIALNNQFSRNLELNVPVCFYEQSNEKYISAPSTVTITLNGKRQDLQTIDVNSLAVHINAQELHNGVNHLVVDHTTLFLPHAVKLVHYTPANSVINVQEKNMQLFSLLNQNLKTQ